MACPKAEWPAYRAGGTVFNRRGGANVIALERLTAVHSASYSPYPLCHSATIVVDRCRHAARVLAQEPLDRIPRAAVRLQPWGVHRRPHGGCRAGKPAESRIQRRGRKGGRCTIGGPLVSIEHGEERDKTHTYATCMASFYHLLLTRSVPCFAVLSWCQARTGCRTRATSTGQ